MVAYGSRRWGQKATHSDPGSNSKGQCSSTGKKVINEQIMVLITCLAHQAQVGERQATPNRVRLRECHNTVALPQHSSSAANSATALTRKA